MTSKNIFLLLVVIGLFFFGFQYYSSKYSVPTTGNPPVVENPPFGGEPVACTMDAMMCPDGTYVGRSGPNCQFVCPTVTPNTTPTTPSAPIISKAVIELNKAQVVGGVTIKAWAVTQDSRCPSDVTCIQAGKATVAVDLSDATGANVTGELEPTKSLTVGTSIVILDDVMPYPNSKHKITDGEYRFAVTVKK